MIVDLTAETSDSESIPFEDSLISFPTKVNGSKEYIETMSVTSILVSDKSPDAKEAVKKSENGGSKSSGKSTKSARTQQSKEHSHDAKKKSSQIETISTKHSRYVCQVHDFEENSILTCDSCCCYVCDVPAKSCKHWQDHCFANPEDPQDGPIWKNMKDENNIRKNRTESEIKTFNSTFYNTRDSEFKSDLPLTFKAWRLMSSTTDTPQHNYLFRKDAPKSWSTDSRGVMQIDTYDERADEGYITDDETIAAGGGSYTFFTETKKRAFVPQNAPSHIKKFDAKFDNFEGPCINFVGRQVPKSLLTQTLTFSRRTVEDQLSATFIDAILAKLINAVNKSYSVISVKPNSAYMSDADLVVNLEMSTSALSMRSSDRVLKWIETVANSLGNNYKGDRVLSFHFNTLPKSDSLKVVIGVRRWFPLPHTPACETAYKIEPSLLMGRVICPLCRYASPVGTTHPRCSVCKLYSCTHNELFDLQPSQQKPPQKEWHALGEPREFDMVLKPDFLSVSRRTCIRKYDGSPHVECDPYTKAMELNQILCFKKDDLGLHPSTDKLKQMHAFRYGDNPSELILQNSYLGEGKLPESEWYPEAAYLKSLLEISSRVSQDNGRNALHVIATIKDPILTPQQLERIPESERALHVACSIRVSFQLYLSPRTVDPVRAINKSGYTSYWGGYNMALSAFCIPQNPQEDMCALQALSPVQAPRDLPAENLLISSLSSEAGLSAGGYACKSRGLAGILQSMQAEALHFGMTRGGACLEDALTYPSGDLGKKYNAWLDRTSAAFERREEFNAAIETGAERCKRMGTNPSALLVECENLGYASISAEHERLLQCELTVGLRNYQKQSLRWALDQECFEGGIMAHISAPVLTKDGQPTDIHYCPYSCTFFKGEAPDVRGGFICEEMGMGKTLITLGLIICNQAPTSTVGPEADEVWKFFSPETLGDPNSANVTTQPEVMDVSVESECEQVLNDEDEGNDAAVIDGAVSDLGAAAEAPHLGHVVSPSPAQKFQTSSFAEILKKFAKATNEAAAAAAASARKRYRVAPENLVRSRATLVVCPVSLVGQWCSEARSKLSGGNLKVLEYHGTKRLRDPVALASFDLVVTTYETLAADYRVFDLGIEWKKAAQKSDFEPRKYYGPNLIAILSMFRFHANLLCFAFEANVVQAFAFAI